MSLSGKPSPKRGVAPDAAVLAIQSGDLLGFNRRTLILTHIVIQKLVLSRINQGRHTHLVPRFSLTLKPVYSYPLYQKGGVLSSSSDEKREVRQTSLTAKVSRNQLK